MAATWGSATGDKGCGKGVKRWMLKIEVVTAEAPLRTGGKLEETLISGNGNGSCPRA